MRCPHCYQPVNVLGTRCPSCTGDIDPVSNFWAEVWAFILSIAVIIGALTLLTTCMG